MLGCYVVRARMVLDSGGKFYGTSLVFKNGMPYAGFLVYDWKIMVVEFLQQAHDRNGLAK